jgi:hypothetical protein
MAQEPNCLAWRQSLRPRRGEDWADDNDTDYIFGLAGNAVLDDALAADTASNLRIYHATSSDANPRSFVSFMKASRQRCAKVVARRGAVYEAKFMLPWLFSVEFAADSTAASPRHETSCFSGLHSKPYRWLRHLMRH